MADAPDAAVHEEATGYGQKRINPRSPREALTPEPAPQPARRSRRVRHPLVVALNALISLLFLALITVGAIAYWGKTEFDAPGPLAADRSVVIRSSSGLREIASLLEAEGVINNQLVFLVGVRAYRENGNLKAGEYAFPAGISMHQVMDLIVSGRAILHQITIPEGLTSQQIVARLRENETLTGEIAEIPPEGSLLPETYSFTRGMSRAALIEQMREAHDEAVAEVWAQRDTTIPIETPEELVILASIVEKETGIADERPLVASVFINRLEMGMRLQSDPTIIYGINGGAGPLGRGLTRSEIDRATPYNTYQIGGLPPGPIANPGRAALEAVARPSETDDVYFVADGSGGHAFAATLDEHNRNVARWRAIEAGQAVAPAPEAAGDRVPREAAEGDDPLGLTDPAYTRRPEGESVLPPPRPDGI
jgi:UPF0755 protein